MGEGLCCRGGTNSLSEVRSMISYLAQSVTLPVHALPRVHTSLHSVYIWTCSRVPHITDLTTLREQSKPSRPGPCLSNSSLGWSCQLWVCFGQHHANPAE